MSLFDRPAIKMENDNSSSSFDEEDELPLSKLVPQVKADRELNVQSAAAASSSSSKKDETGADENAEDADTKADVKDETAGKDGSAMEVEKKDDGSTTHTERDATQANGSPKENDVSESVNHPEPDAEMLEKEDKTNEGDRPESQKETTDEMMESGRLVKDELKQNVEKSEATNDEVEDKVEESKKEEEPKDDKVKMEVDEDASAERKTSLNAEAETSGVESQPKEEGIALNVDSIKKNEEKDGYGDDVMKSASDELPKDSSEQKDDSIEKLDHKPKDTTDDEEQVEPTKKLGQKGEPTPESFSENSVRRERKGVEPKTQQEKETNFPVTTGDAEGTKMTNMQSSAIVKSMIDPSVGNNARIVTADLESSVTDQLLDTFKPPVTSIEKKYQQIEENHQETTKLSATGTEPQADRTHDAEETIQKEPSEATKDMAVIQNRGSNSGAESEKNKEDDSVDGSQKSIAVFETTPKQEMKGLPRPSESDLPAGDAEGGEKDQGAEATPMEVDTAKSEDSPELSLGNSASKEETKALDSKQDLSQDQVTESTPVTSPIIRQVVEPMSEEEEDFDPFEAFNRKKSKDVKKKKKKKNRKAMKVLKLTTRGTMEDKPEAPQIDKAIPQVQLQSDSLIPSTTPYLVNVEAEFEDSLDFFQEPHEDQDPAYKKFQQEQKAKNLEEQIKKLEAEDESGRKEIEIIVTEQLREKQASTDRSVEKYKLKTAAEEKRQVQHLLQNYNNKSNLKQQQINQGIQVLKNRHTKESQAFHEKHRHHAEQRRWTQQMEAAEWATLSQRLQARQQRQLQEFLSKGNEVKRRNELEYKREEAKIRKNYEERLHDLEKNRQQIYTRMLGGFNQLRQRYVKRHVQKITKKKDTLTRALVGDSAANTEAKEKVASHRDRVKSSREDKVELRPPSPIKSCEEWYKESPYERSGAAARHKHRKGVLSQINKQLSVEIHNEGIWIAQILEKKSDDAESKKTKIDSSRSEGEEKHFIPWGVKARDLLESIICGEIPQAFGSEYFSFGEAAIVNGGHVRCVMTDLRTSDQTASAQRAAAVHEKERTELKALEKKVSDLTAVATKANESLSHLGNKGKDLENKAQHAMKDVESKKMAIQNFRNKFSRYLNRGKLKSVVDSSTQTTKLTFENVRRYTATDHKRK